METKEYDELSTYLDLAKKTISKFAPKFIAKEMLSCNDAVSDVATAIMFADWKFDPNRVGSKTGAKKTLYSYRNQCAIWAIKTYITNKYKTKNSTKYSLDFSPGHGIQGNETATIVNQLSDNKSKDPLDILIENEQKQIISESVYSLLNSPILSDKQKDQIKLYYIDNLTLSAIGKKYGVSREAVRQNIKRAIDSIKQYV
jgi:RNA polymerase sigma factor (sigma-70 family)